MWILLLLLVQPLVAFLEPQLLSFGQVLPVKPPVSMGNNDSKGGQHTSHLILTLPPEPVLLSAPAYKRGLKALAG
jgi:hypothetical protein